MLNFFYRLTRKKGAVLFAVIAIMTLLIAMASTAYLTARASYKTVLSNYDFSQMYLSATSVSDMMIAAVSQDTMQPTVNKFADLKAEIKNLKTKAPGTDAAKIVGTSTNIHGKTTQSAILAAAAAHPVEDGVLDAVKVEISLDRKDSDTPSAGLDTYYFTFQTTAYYRDNMVTVTDTIYNVSGTAESSSVMPKTFFTATGQILDSGGKKKGTRAVCIDTKDISDNAYFENTYTVFTTIQGAGNENMFHGGITTAGGLYMMGNFNTAKDVGGTKVLTIPAPNATTGERHDWMIGGDFVIVNDNSGLNLNGNNLYVNGDLIICSQQTISAANIYVTGNIIFTNGSQSQKFNVTGGVYCGGDIIAKKADEATLSHRWSGNSGWTTVADEVNGIKGMVNTAMTKANASATVASISNEGNFNSWSIAGSGKLYQTTGKTQTGFNNTITSQGNFDPAGTSVQISTKVEDGHSFKYETSTTTVADVLDTSNGQIAQHTYGSYTADKTVYQNKLTIDLSNPAAVLAKIDDNHYKAVFYSTNGEMATVDVLGTDYNNAYSIKIDLPASDTGYLLDIKSRPPANEWDTPFPKTNTANTYYNIHTKNGKTTPIVLAPNFYDANSGDAKDGEGHNAFSWAGNLISNAGKNTYVQLVDEGGTGTAQGNIIFEMANIAKSPVTIDSVDYAVNEFCPYDASKASSIGSAVYFANNKEFVGTKAQLDYFLGLGKETPAEYREGFVDLLNGNVPKTGYENRVMLVSNKNNDKAVDAFRFQNTFCGYVYAPNGSFYAYSDGKMPVFGGLIVSDYVASHAYFTYAEPDPTIIKSLLGALNEDEDSGDPTPEDGIWYLSGPGIGKNYLG